MLIYTKTDQGSRHCGRISLTAIGNKCGEVNDIQGITVNDKTCMNPEQVTLVQSLNGQGRYQDQK